MNSAEKIKRLFAKSDVTVHAKIDDRIVGDALTAFDKSEETTPISAGPNRWRKIMNNRITKLAAAAVIVIGALVVISQFGGSVDVSSVAFGDVLQQILNSSYTFDVTTIGDPKDGTYHGMILPSVGFRVDCPEEGVSSITNFKTGEVLVLFHGNKTAITELPDTENLAESGPFAVFFNSIEDLRNLKDGTEKSLGEKEIGGQPAAGFEIRYESKDYLSDTVVWAHKETGAPIRVEITLHNPDNLHSVTIVMSNFDLSVQLDEELFSTEPPEGYRATTHQKLREDPASVYLRQ